MEVVVCSSVPNIMATVHMRVTVLETPLNIIKTNMKLNYYLSTDTRIGHAIHFLRFSQGYLLPQNKKITGNFLKILK